MFNLNPPGMPPSLPLRSVDSFGNISDISGRTVARIGRFGAISDTSGRPIGHVDRFGNILAGNSGITAGTIGPFGSIR